MLARVSEDRELRAGAEEVAATGAVQREARELLGDGG